MTIISVQLEIKYTKQHISIALFIDGVRNLIKNSAANIVHTVEPNSHLYTLSLIIIRFYILHTWVLTYFQTDFKDSFWTQSTSNTDLGFFLLPRTLLLTDQRRIDTCILFATLISSFIKTGQPHFFKKWPHVKAGWGISTINLETRDIMICVLT